MEYYNRGGQRTMKQILIPEDKQLDKVTEIEIIHEFYKALPEDSYLKKILVNIPDYCEDQINNDWVICPLEEANGLQAGLEEKEAGITKLEEKVEDITKLLVAAEAKAIRARDDEDRSKVYYAAETEYYNKGLQTIKDQEQQIIELKAKLYDVLIGGAK